VALRFLASPAVLPFPSAGTVGNHGSVQIFMAFE
jgi:hypothetical protein